MSICTTMIQRSREGIPENLPLVKSILILDLGIDAIVNYMSLEFF